MPTRVGIDLVDVDAVRESVRVHERRYLDRVYTEGELRDCQTPGGFDHERLAARFAAKEATMKVLRPGAGEGLPWTSIGVRRHRTGWTELELSGRAAEMATAAGINDLALSMSHERGCAAAVVIGRSEGSDG